MKFIYISKALALTVYWAIHSLNIYRICGIAVIALALQCLSQAMMPGRPKSLLIVSIIFALIGSNLILKHK